MSWNPVTHPFVVRSHRQSNQAGCFGWVVRNVGSALATYEEARRIADKPMGLGEIDRTVCQAINPETWSMNGSWRTCFKRARGNKITEAGPVETRR